MDIQCRGLHVFSVSAAGINREEALQQLLTMAQNTTGDPNGNSYNYETFDIFTVTNWVGSFITTTSDYYMMQCLYLKNETDGSITFVHSNVFRVTGKLKDSTPSPEPSPVTEPPAFIWNGNSFIADFNVSDNYYLNGSLSTSITNWSDFAFDKNGNLYISYKVEDDNFRIVRFNKENASYNSNFVTIVEDTDSMKMFSDTENDVLYVGAKISQYCIYSISNISQIQSSITVPSQFEYYFSLDDVVGDFVVNGNEFYFIFGTDKVIRYVNNGGVFGTPDSKTLGNNRIISDIQIYNNKAYILCYNQDSSRLKGALYVSAENFDAGNFYLETASDINDSTSTLCGPKKFISNVEGKLIIADEGLIKNGSEVSNVNRVVSVDISGNTPSISSITSVQELFDSSYEYDDSGKSVTVTSLF